MQIGGAILARLQSAPPRCSGLIAHPTDWLVSRQGKKDTWVGQQQRQKERHHQEQNGGFRRRFFSALSTAILRREIIIRSGKKQRSREKVPDSMSAESLAHRDECATPLSVAQRDRLPIIRMAYAAPSQLASSLFNIVKKGFLNVLPAVLIRRVRPHSRKTA
ncbi:unnamed protein product [Caenorhabditis auriculariae]|uniref:Uncharacterized protein n=1 Tax=Caenorhabditis auriculariae TaxID=2777116 RepID=A0A8S1HL48_9PELO|nr:unnamed protein product [Caenorhabditis auriculariae]